MDLPANSAAPRDENRKMQKWQIRLTIIKTSQAISCEARSWWGRVQGRALHQWERLVSCFGLMSSARHRDLNARKSRIFYKQNPAALLPPLDITESCGVGLDLCTVDWVACMRRRNLWWRTRSDGCTFELIKPEGSAFPSFLISWRSRAV